MTAVELAERPSEIGAEVVETATSRALIVRLGEPHEVLSWAIVNGGRTKTDLVVWREVRLAELGPTVDAAALLRETLAQVGAPRAVGLLTARDIRRYEIERVERDGVQAECIATVGLGNLLAVGDPTAADRLAGRDHQPSLPRLGRADRRGAPGSRLPSRPKLARRRCWRPDCGAPSPGGRPRERGRIASSSLLPRRPAPTVSRASTPAAGRRLERRSSARFPAAWRDGSRRILVRRGDDSCSARSPWTSCSASPRLGSIPSSGWAARKRRCGGALPEARCRPSFGAPSWRLSVPASLAGWPGSSCDTRTASCTGCSPSSC